MITTKHPLDSIITLNSGEDRDEWLKARVAYYTATKVTAIVGSNPYTGVIDVWNEMTDPSYDGEHLRNIYLEERAALGSEREPEIIAWLNESKEAGSPEHPFVPNSRLVTRKGLTDEASTPDAARKVGRKLALAECKATQQRWDVKGIPQHILDQCFWQMHTTGAVVVWLAVEFYEWTGRGKNKVPVKVGQMVRQITQDEKRLAFMLEKLEEFRGWVADGIAPESDIRLDEEPVFGFDDTPEQIAEKEEAAAEAKRLAALLDEEAEIVKQIDALSALEKRRKEISAEIKKVIVNYEGRRVHMIGTRRIAKFVRFNQAKTDTSMLSEATLREITSWPEQTRLVIEPNPEYVEPEEADEAVADEMVADG